MSYTFAVLEVSQATYEEIRRKLEAADYQHAFLRRSAIDGSYELIDMHGIALQVEGGMGAR